MKIPSSNQAVMPYLILKGAAKFIDFTKTVFGAVSLPKNLHMRDEHTIQHGEIMIEDSTIMFADSTKEFKSSPSGLFVYVENADKTYKKALEAGGKSVMDLSDQSYGRTCGVEDPCGNVWWITSVK